MNMWSGVGPMGQTISKVNYSVFYSKRTIKRPDEWNNYSQKSIRGQDVVDDGIQVYATSQNMVTVNNFNQKNVEPNVEPLPKVLLTCFDFAPFLY